MTHRNRRTSESLGLSDGLPSPDNGSFGSFVNEVGRDLSESGGDISLFTLGKRRVARRGRRRETRRDFGRLAGRKKIQTTTGKEQSNPREKGR